MTMALPTSPGDSGCWMMQTTEFAGTHSFGRFDASKTMSSKEYASGSSSSGMTARSERYSAEKMGKRLSVTFFTVTMPGTVFDFDVTAVSSWWVLT